MSEEEHYAMKKVAVNRFRMENPDPMLKVIRLTELI
jgi:hypothetical protein